MRTSRIFVWLGCFFFLTGPCLYAQTGSVSAGGEASGIQGTVSYSIGQANFITTIATEGTINRGLQQPYEIYVLSGVDETISIFPNPTVAGYVTLKIVSDKLMDFSYELFSIQGKHHVTKKVETRETIVPMSEFAMGTYVIRVLHHEQERKSFKIIKSQ
jgi:hypothetical protein